MIWFCFAFLIGGIFFYPVTFLVKPHQGKLHLYWLPRLFMSYAQPIHIPIKKFFANKKLLGRKKKNKRCRTIHYYLRLIGATRLQKLCFNFLIQNRGESRFTGECIISITLWDIIRKSLCRKWLKLRRGIYGWRA